MELPGLIEIDDVDAGIRVLEAAQIPHVATQTDVVVEIAHHTCAQVPARHVVRRVDVVEPVNLRPNEAEPTRHERSYSGPTRATHWHADNDVAHEIDHAVVAENAFRSEEAGTEAEVELTTDNALAHPAGIHTEAGAAVIEVAESCPGIRSHPRADVPFRVSERGRKRHRERRCQNERFQYTSHDCCSSCMAEAFGLTPALRLGEPVQAMCPAKNRVR